MHASAETHAEVDEISAWRSLLAWRDAQRRGERLAPPDPNGWVLGAFYSSLCASAAANDGIVIAHLAQSLDGRIATLRGASQWITGPEDLSHTHRMRALADAVLVGTNTVVLDDPMLTVRRCEGRNPVRVVLDPRGQIAGERHVFDGAAPTLLLVPDGAASSHPAVEVVHLPVDDGRFHPEAIRRALAARGLKWLFIEGGGVTVSRFIEAGVLDRLQLVIAPVVLGSGRPALSLPEIAHPAGALRPPVRRIELGDDVLVECILR